VLEAAFILLEFLSPSRRIFIGAHSLPPLWFAVSVLHPANIMSNNIGPHADYVFFATDLRQPVEIECIVNCEETKIHGIVTTMRLLNALIDV
jgi:hypothetical protein